MTIRKPWIESSVTPDFRFQSKQDNIRQLSFTNRYLEVACWALAQEDYAFGNDLIKEIFTFNPAVFSGEPAQFIRELIKHSIRNINEDHERTLNRISCNLSPQFQHLESQLNWAVTRGYLLKGIQEMIWGRTETGMTYLKTAKLRKAKIDNLLLDRIVAQLLIIQNELGDIPANESLSNIQRPISELGGKSSFRYLRADYGLNKAFSFYHKEKYEEVLREVIWVSKYAPSKIINRGVGAIIIKSTAKFLNIHQKG